MLSISRNLVMLALVASVGCHSTARSAPWQARRVPAWRPAPMSPQTPASPRTVAPSFPPARSRPAPEIQGKIVPEPTPDPQSRTGAVLSDKINAQANKPPPATPAESPQLRFKPVPPNRSLDREPTDGTGVGSRETARGETPQDAGVSPRRPAPTPTEVESDAKTSSGKIAGPSLGFEALPPPNDSPLNLAVTGQRQRPLGGSVTFDVVVRNDGTSTISGVVVNVDFDDTMIFPGREEKRLKKELGQFLPGQSREMRLTLMSNRIGKHDCRFSVSADGIDPVEHTSTVEFIDPKLLVRLVGPARRSVGSRAEFTVKVANTSDQPIDDLKVALHHDAALTPHVATGGFQREEHSLRWSLGRLEPGAGVQVQAEFDCRQLAEQACVSAEARSESLSAVAVEDCVTVVAVPGLLDLRVSDRNDPVKVGEDAEFEITVQNLSLQALSEVQLDVQTSEHLQVGKHEVKIGEREVAPTKSDVNGTLRLILPSALPPDATLTLTLHAKVLRPGDAEVRVIATPGADATPVETIEFTSINP